MMNVTGVMLFMMLAFILRLKSVTGNNDYPKIQTIEHLQSNKYAGHWYVIGSIGRFDTGVEEPSDLDYKCLESVYFPKKDGLFEVIENSVDQESSEIESFTLFINLSSSCYDNDVTRHYVGSVLGTDYDNYAVEYYCNIFGKGFAYEHDKYREMKADPSRNEIKSDLTRTSEDVIFILSRRKTLDKSFDGVVIDIIRSHGLDPLNVQPILQDCPPIECDAQGCRFLVF